VLYSLFSWKIACASSQPLLCYCLPGAPMWNWRCGQVTKLAKPVTLEQSRSYDLPTIRSSACSGARHSRATILLADNRTRKTRPTAPPQTVRQAGAQSQPSRVLGTQHGLCSLSSQQIGRCAEYIPRV